MTRIYGQYTYFHFVQKDNGEYNIVLDSPLSFSVGDGIYTVKSGYSCNGMSVPRWLWSFISPQFHPVTIFPSVCHDYMYDNHIVCRKDADKWYRDALVENGYATWKSWLVYYAVRLFGGSHWEC